MNKITPYEKFVNISEAIKYHLANNISIFENIFRPESYMFFALFEEARNIHQNTPISELFDTTDIGLFGIYENEKVPLDMPLLEAQYHGKDVELNKPSRSSGPKKYKVFVKNPKTGKIKKINFGDVKGGLTAKIHDPEARKSFTARMKCGIDPKSMDKMYPKYWACHLNSYTYLFGGGKKVGVYW